MCDNSLCCTVECHKLPCSPECRNHCQRGKRGNKGDTGPRGWTGAQGPKCMHDHRGFQGLQADFSTYSISDAKLGAKGLQGATGFQGVAGNDGIVFVGSQGLHGSQGQTLKGFDGVQGPKGPEGTTWVGAFLNDDVIQGPQGVSGSQGEDGDIGFEGPQGHHGITGNVGPHSELAIASNDELLEGEAGFQGLCGAQGFFGIIGTQGVATIWNQGSQGLIGCSGVQGISIQGPQGFEGENFNKRGAQGSMGSQGTETAERGPQGLQSTKRTAVWNPVTIGKLLDRLPMVFRGIENNTGFAEMQAQVGSRYLVIVTACVSPTTFDGESTEKTLVIYDLFNMKASNTQTMDSITKRYNIALHATFVAQTSLISARIHGSCNFHAFNFTLIEIEKVELA